MHKNVVVLGTLDISTRPSRRRAVSRIVHALGMIHSAEFDYLNRIPLNLHGGEAYAAADDSLDYLCEAIIFLDDAY